MSKSLRTFLSRLTGALALFTFAALPVQLSAQTASVRVVHGIPGPDVSPAVDPALPVDVLVNDALCLLSGFTFGDIAGPFTIPGGTYNVKISLANSLEPCSGDPVIEADVPVEAGENVSIVAHLADGGAPTASKFVNDVSTPMEGNARLIAHHVANAPVVDLLVPGRFASTPLLWVPGVGNVPGANQAAAEIPATQAQISILPAGGSRPVFTRILQARAGLTYTAYAVGSLTNGTFTIIVEPIGGLKGIDVRF
ncbi:MAG: DUF4397 domain-containing protein [Bryobacterales bacterium]